MVVTSSGFMIKRMRAQDSTVQIRLNGSPTAIQCPNDTLWPACSRYEVARAFCRLDIGVTMPPKLHAKASPRRSDLANRESVGTSLTIGRMIEPQRIGAVWFEILSAKLQ